MAPRGISRQHFHKDTAATQVASAQVLSTTPTLGDENSGAFNCSRHGSVVYLATLTDLETSATVVTIRFYLEFSMVPIADATASDWFRETEEDSSGDITLKVRTLTIANFTDGDDVILGDIKCGSYQAVRIYLYVAGSDTPTSTVSVWAAGGAE